jgi:hypothetical protein
MSSGSVKTMFGSSVSRWPGPSTARMLLPKGCRSAQRQKKTRKVVGVYEMDVTIEDGAHRPGALRERIRAKGPTTHPQLGKQAQAVSA